MRGLLITLEGMDGVGKTTQAKLLGEHFKSLGHDVVVTREPGGCIEAEALRHVCMVHELTPLAECYAMAASRAEHIERVIRPALAAGKVVICDRYIDSMRVYQGLTGVDSDLIEYLIRRTVSHETTPAWPDVTLIYALDRQEQEKRLSKRKNSQKNRYDLSNAEFQAKVQEGFLKLAIQREQSVEDPYEVINAAQEKHEALLQARWAIYFNLSNKNKLIDLSYFLRKRNDAAE